MMGRGRGAPTRTGAAISTGAASATGRAGARRGSACPVVAGGAELVPTHTSATIRRRSSSRGAHRSADRDRDGGDNGPRTKVLRLLCAIHKFALVDVAFALQHAIEATSADVRALQATAQRALLN